jgi:hypothetical protein
MQAFLQRLQPLWLSAWPLLALVVFASLAATHWLPSGYVRAAVAAPILMVPGSLTLVAVLGHDRRPRGAAFICCSALLSVIWFGLSSLLLYMIRGMITTDGMYWYLLVICAALATVAQARLELRQLDLGPALSSRAAGRDESLNPDPPDRQTRRAPLYAVVAVGAGLSLLAGGVYLQEHVFHTAPAGYTWMAWQYPEGTDEFAVGSAGAKLPFKIVHQQAGLTTFRLSAAWQGGRSGSLAKPLVLRLGPNRTFHAALFVPPLPQGCSYRVAITLSATRQLDPFTRRPQSWSINAGVHGQGKPQKMCKR